MINPIFKREFKTELRGWKYTGLVTIYGLLLVFFAYLFYKSTTYDNYIRLGSIEGMFIGLVYFLYIAISFVAPAFTSSSINSERNGRSFDMLVCSPISERRIIIGKLLSGLVYVFILLLLTLPLFSFLLLFGGISVFNILGIFLYLILISCLYGSIGVFMSSKFDNTAIATVLSYVLILVLNFMTLFIGMLLPEILKFENSLKGVFNYLALFSPGMGISLLISKMSSNMRMGSIFGVSEVTAMALIIGIQIVSVFVYIRLTIKEISPIKE